MAKVPSNTVPSNPGPPSPRPSIGMMWKCCRVYSRVYLKHAGTHFAGHCPRCGASLRIVAVPSDTPGPGFWVAE